MSRLNFATAASRADRALYVVKVRVACDECFAWISCTVEGMDVSVGTCENGCDSDRDLITDNALSRATAERDGLRQHYLEGGR